MEQSVVLHLSVRSERAMPSVYDRPVEIWRVFVPNGDVLAVATSEQRALGEDGKPN